MNSIEWRNTALRPSARARVTHAPAMAVPAPPSKFNTTVPRVL